MYGKLADLSRKELDAIIRDVANRKGINNAIVEKDFWVCFVLEYLFQRSPWKENLAFKGGTSLSKAYNLIERFSEDIDIILDWRLLGYDANYPYEERSNNQQEKLNKEIISKTDEFIRSKLIPRMREDFAALTRKDFSIFFHDEAVVIEYGNSYSDTSILSNIRLEIGALAAWTPTQDIDIQPFVAEVYPDRFRNSSIMVRTTTPERTFWEKATILHREAFRPEDSIMPARMSRHYYDVDRMSQLSVLEKALSKPELLEQVANFKAKFYPQRWAHYELANFESLRLVPPEHSLRALKEDYAAMAGMFYGPYPEFDQLIENIVRIETKIRASLTRKS